MCVNVEILLTNWYLLMFLFHIYRYVFSVGSFFSRARRFGSDSEALTMSHPLMTSPPAQVTRQASEGASLMRPDRRIEESMPSTCTSGRTPREGIDS